MNKKIKIDLLGDGVPIKVPIPKGSCGTCKYASIQIFVGTHYIHQPKRERCKKCNVVNGMKNYEPGIINWSKVTKLTEENPVVVNELLKSWKKRSD